MSRTGQWYKAYVFEESIERYAIDRKVEGVRSDIPTRS